MGTHKQLTESYEKVLRAAKKLRSALSEAEDVGLLPYPKDSEGKADFGKFVWKPLNEIDNLVQSLSAPPLGESLQKEIRSNIK